MRGTMTNYLYKHDQVARQVANFGRKRRRSNSFLNATPNEGDSGTQTLRPHTETPEGDDRVYRVRRMSRRFVVERAKIKEDKCRLGKEAQRKPRRPSHSGRGVIPKRTVGSPAKLKAWGLDMQVSRLQKAAVIGSVKALELSG